jgi:hypothetical protein
VRRASARPGASGFVVVEIGLVAQGRGALLERQVQRHDGVDARRQRPRPDRRGAGGMTRSIDAPEFSTSRTSTTFAWAIIEASRASAMSSVRNVASSSMCACGRLIATSWRNPSAPRTCPTCTVAMPPEASFRRTS